MDRLRQSQRKEWIAIVIGWVERHIEAERRLLKSSTYHSSTVGTDGGTLATLAVPSLVRLVLASGAAVAGEKTPERQSPVQGHASFWAVGPEKFVTICSRHSFLQHPGL